MTYIWSVKLIVISILGGKNPEWREARNFTTVCFGLCQNQLFCHMSDEKQSFRKTLILT
jgi:hypothetical protein